MRDPESVKAARRRWYARNKEHAKAAVVDRKRKLASRLAQYKVEQGCRSCGECHPAVLDVHHVTPLLDSNPHTRIYSMIWRNGWGGDRIMTHFESECWVLCANCHRKIHWRDRAKASSLRPSFSVSSASAQAVVLTSTVHGDTD